MRKRTTPFSCLKDRNAHPDSKPSPKMGESDTGTQAAGCKAEGKKRPKTMNEERGGRKGLLKASQ